MATDRNRRRRWRGRAVLAVMVATALHTGRAAAEPVVEVDAVGEASGGGDDLRTRAIDDGFARALEQLLGDELGVARLREHRDSLRRHIVRRARLYVVSFRVLDQEAGEGTMRVELRARLDVGKLRAALAELDLGESARQAPRTRARPKVVVLLHATSGGATSATFGIGGGDGGVAGKSFVAALTDLGFDVVSAAGKPAPVVRRAGGRLPVDAEGAVALAREVGAGGAFVVGIEIREDGTVRGTLLHGAVGQGEVRVYAGDGTEVSHAEVEGAGYAAAAADALSGAARAVAERAVGAIGDRVTRYWPAPRRLDDASAVVIRGVRRWATVEAIMAALRSSREVTEVVPSGLGPDQIGLAVATSLAPSRLAALIGSARPEGVTLTARERGKTVEVGVVEAAPTEVAP